MAYFTPSELVKSVPKGFAYKITGLPNKIFGTNEFVLPGTRFVNTDFEFVSVRSFFQRFSGEFLFSDKRQERLNYLS